MERMRITRDLPVESYDVIVAGGGLSGVCAAVAAAREGARTLLLEATGALGGMATQGLVPNWCGQHDKQQIIQSGLAKTIMNAATPEPERYDFVQTIPCIHAEWLKRACDALVERYGVELLLQTSLTSVEAENGEVKAVVIANKAGLSACRAKVYIDCTGDGDLAAWAGAQWQKGDENGQLQPATHCFVLANVEVDADKSGWHPDWQQQIIADPRFPLIRDDFFNLGSNPSTRVTIHNSGHLFDVDATDPRNLTHSLMRGRQLAYQHHQALREYCPSRCADSYLAATGTLLGIRETRRILGDYVLTADDHRNRRRFSDEIALNSFFLDSHPTLRQREQEKQGLFNWTAEMQRSTYGPGEFHGIPFRCLTPLGLRNVLVAGRCISADREAQGSVRVMPVCMSEGEAAGIAAAQQAQIPHPDVHQTHVAKVRRRLREEGAFLPEQTRPELLDAKSTEPAIAST